MRKLASAELIISLVIGLITAALFYHGLFEKYEVRTIDDRVRWRGDVRSTAPIILVGVTDDCLKEFNWPIDRGIYADVIEKLFRWGARSICLDIFIDDKVEEKGAARLVETVRNNQPVVLPVVLQKVTEVTSLNGMLPGIDDTISSSDTTSFSPVETFEELAAVSNFQGYINVGWKEDINHDGIVRKIPLVNTGPNLKQPWYSMSLLGAATYLDEQPRFEKGQIFLGNKKVPLWTDFNGRKLHLVNYLTMKTKLESFSFRFKKLSEVASFNGAEWPDFSGKTVIIGPAYGQADYYSGPVKPVRGMEIHALISASLITGDHITRLPIPVSFLIIVAFSTVTAWFLQRFSRWVSSGLIVATLGGTVAGTLGLFSGSGIIIEFIPTFLGTAAAAVIVKFYQLYLRLFFANRDLRVENRRLATLYRISSDLASTSITERKDRLKLLLNRTVIGVQADGGFLLMYDPLTEELVSELVQYGNANREEHESDQTPCSFIVPVGEGALGKTVMTGKSAIFQLNEIEPGIALHIKQYCRYEFSSLIAVPMILGDKRPVGLINLFRGAGTSSFTPDDLALVESVAAQAGGVIENARLYRLATVDGLTGLFVHRHFQTRLEEELRRATRYDSQLSLMMTDIDHFKKFNDTYGHQIGDYVLKGVANILRDAVRDIDVPARYGGEEFSVILPETDMNGAYTLAERLRKRVETYTFTPPGHELHVTVSIGVSNYPTSDISEKEKLIEYADSALYEAKNAGRNRTVIHK